MTFNVLCGNNYYSNWKILPVDGNSITSCNPVLEIYHPAGCYVSFWSQFFGFKKLVCWGFVGLVLYFFIGYLINKTKYGL